MVPREATQTSVSPFAAAKLVAEDSVRAARSAARLSLEEHPVNPVAISYRTPSHAHRNSWEIK